MASTNSTLLRPHTAPGSETRFQLWGGGDGGFTCEIGPRIRKQRSLRHCLRILASNRVFEVAVVGFEQLVDVWNIANTVSITAQVTGTTGANVTLEVLRLDGTVIGTDNAALILSDGEVALTVAPWVLSGEGIVKVRVTVNAPLLVSVRFNDTVLAVAP